MTRPLRILLWLLLIVVGVGGEMASRSLAQEAPAELERSAPAPEELERWRAAPADAASPDAAPAPAPATQPAAPQPRGGLSPALPPPSQVAIIRIDGMIYDFTLESLRKRTDQAIQDGASLIVIELHTDGGLVTSAIDISRHIKNLPVPTVAWINNRAYSAGILIASACREIVMSPASATGDCAPIAPGMNLAPTERAKALSPILAEFRDNARQNGYDYTLFHAMCELGVEVYQVQNPQTGEIRLVNQADYEVMVRGASPDALRDAARRRTQSAQNAPAPTLPPLLPQPSPLPAPASTAPAGPPIDPAELGGDMPQETTTDADRGAWVLVKQIHDGKSLLTLNQNEALDAGLASAIVRSDAELQQHLNAGAVTRVQLPWVQGTAYWLTRPWVRALLVVIMLVAAYIELQAPGLGVSGGIALLALLLLIVSPFLVGIAQVWHLIVFGIGLALLIFELVTPGFAIFGFSGLILMFIGLVFMAMPSSGGPLSLPAPELWGRLQQSVLLMVGAFAVSGVAFVLLARYFGSIPVLNRLVLHDAALPATAGVGAASGGAAVPAPPMAPVAGDEAIGEGRIAVGDAGQAVSHLRPSGRAAFDGRVIDVVTLGAWVEPGQPVRVVEVHGNRIVVDAVRRSTA